MPVLKAVANDKLVQVVHFVLYWYQQRSYYLATHNLPLAVALVNTRPLCHLTAATKSTQTLHVSVVHSTIFRWTIR